MIQHWNVGLPMHMGLMRARIAHLEAENLRLQQEKNCHAEQIVDLGKENTKLIKKIAIREAEALNLEKECAVCKQDNANLREQIRYDALEFEHRVSELATCKISHLEVGNLPPSANEHMIKSRFGQYGFIESVTFRGFGCNRIAEVKFEYEEDARSALSWSGNWGINLKSQRLSVKAVFDTE